MTKEQFITFKEDLKKAIEAVKLANKWKKKWWNCGFNTKEDYETASAERWKKYNELRDSIVCRVDDIGWSYEEHKWLSTGGTKPAFSANCPTVHQAYYIAKHQLTDEEAVEYLKKSLSHQKDYRGVSNEELEKDAKFWLKHHKEGLISLYENLDVKSE